MNFLDLRKAVGIQLSGAVGKRYNFAKKWKFMYSYHVVSVQYISFIYVDPATTGRFEGNDSVAKLYTEKRG